MAGASYIALCITLCFLLQGSVSLPGPHIGHRYAELQNRRIQQRVSAPSDPILVTLLFKSNPRWPHVGETEDWIIVPLGKWLSPGESSAECQGGWLLVEHPSESKSTDITCLLLNQAHD